MNKFSEKKYYRACWNSPLGCLEISWTDQGLISVQKIDKEPFEEDLALDGIGKKAVGQLSEYFAGQRRQFDIALLPQGTQFQKRVWEKLCAIPYGETRYYQEIARSMGSPKSARAVGMANHRNPIAIIIPCHRVIGKNGSLVGYAGGLDMKARLLQLEGVLKSS